MALKGDLASVDLAQVFQMLALNQKVGMLSIQGPGSWKALYFDQRGVTLYFNEHLLLDRVLGSMVRTGRLLAESVQDARDHAAQRGHGVVDSFLAGGYLTEEDVDAGFRREIEEEVYDLFFWKDARFEFFEAATAFEGRDGTINERYFFATDTLIMEAARRIDEWSFIQERVPTENEIYRAAENPNVMKLDDTALAVVELVDGKRNVQRLIEVTGLPAFHVFKSLAILLDEGCIDPVEPFELADAAKECVADGRLQDAINLYERAISFGEALPETHALAAQAYEAMQEYEMAAYHLKCVVEFCSEDNPGRAVQLLSHVIDMIPTDLAARERLVELTVGTSEFKDVDPIAEGKALVDLYLEMGETERVRGVLERLLRDNPDDLELKKSLINVHTKAGDSKRVVELYESIAESLVREGEPIEAVKYLQKILMLDRARKDISERIKSLYEMDERRRSRRRSMIALGALFVVIAALGCVWYFYEQHARARFERLDVSELVDAKEFVNAAAVYKSFLQSYPLTLVAQDAESAMARIESMQAAHEAQVKNERIQDTARKKKLRSQYRGEWDRYQTEFDSKNLAAALGHLEKVYEMVGSLNDTVDHKWAEQVGLERNVKDLRAYVSRASALERSARDLLAAGKWRDARKELLELTSRFEITEVAKRARIPVMLSSTPTGASIYRKGNPVTAKRGDKVAPLVTPALVFCHPSFANTFELRRKGFKPTKARVDYRGSAVSHHVLTVVPSSIIEFGAPVQTPVGANGGYVVVGLRGGSLGVARVDGKVLSTIQLGGLREVQGAPVLTMHRLFFRTGEAELLCYSLARGNKLYHARLSHSPVHDPVVQDGRVLFGDTGGGLVCLDMETGRQLWRTPIPGQLSGPPDLYRRHVRIGTQSGRFMIFDVINGSKLAEHKGLPGLRSPAFPADGLSVFATVDSEVVGIGESRGRILWRAPVGRVVVEEEMCAAGDSVLVVGDSGTLVKLTAANGKRAGTFELPGRYLSGPVYRGGRAYLTVREEVEDGKPADLLLAIDVKKFEVAWEYRDGGQFRGPVSTDGSAVYLPVSGAKVMRFQ